MTKEIVSAVLAMAMIVALMTSCSKKMGTVIRLSP